MKKILLLLTLTSILTAFAQMPITKTVKKGDVGKGSSENGWVLNDVTFKLTVALDRGYKGSAVNGTLKKVYWLEGSGSVDFDFEGYQYKGKFYSKSKLEEIQGGSIFSIYVKYLVSFNKHFENKEGTAGSGSGKGIFYLSTERDKKDTQFKYDELDFLTTKITKRTDAGIENAIEQYLKKEKKKKEGKEKKPKKEKEDDFWNGGKEKTKTKKLRIKTQSDDDFWSGKETITKDDDDFWSGEKTKLEKETKIKPKSKEKYITFKIGEYVGLKNNHEDEIIFPAKYKHITIQENDLFVVQETPQFKNIERFRDLPLNAFSLVDINNKSVLGFKYHLAGRGTTWFNEVYYAKIKQVRTKSGAGTNTKTMKKKYSESVHFYYVHTGIKYTDDKRRKSKKCYVDLFDIKVYSTSNFKLIDELKTEISCWGYRYNLR